MTVSRITSIQVYPISFLLPKALTWGAGKSLSELNHLLVAVHAGDVVGYAEAVPRKSILGETSKTVLEYYRSIAKQLTFPLTKEHIDEFSNEIFENAGDWTAKAALNCAMYEALAQVEGKSLSELLGIPQKPTDVCMILPKLEEKEAFAEGIKGFIDKGITGFKVKLTGDQKRDVDIIEVLNEFPECLFYLDGNELYTLETARNLVDTIATISNVLYLEEPIPVDQTKARQHLVGYIQEKGYKLRIVGDDSCKTFIGIKEQIKLKTISMLNLKVPRTGITEGLRILNYCQEHKLPVMIGSHAAYIIAARHACLLVAHPAVTSKLNEVVYWVNVAEEDDIVERPRIDDGKVYSASTLTINFAKITEEPAIITIGGN